MFGFEDLEDGAADRYVERVAKTPPRWPARAVRHGWWLFHNVVAHPLIGVFPIKPLFELHDWSSRKMHGR